MAGPVWNDIMTAATAHLPIVDFPTPPPPKSGTVPNIVGLKKAEALTVLAAASFSANPVDGPCVKPKGTVCDQTPAAGATAPLGTAVRFTVSNGTPPSPSPSPTPTGQVKVPNVVGMTKDGATAALKSDGFKVAVTHKDTGNHSEDGKVLSQDPPGGSMADNGSVVTIVVGRYKKGAPALPAPPPSGTRGSGVPPWGAPLLALGVPLGALGVLRSRVRRR